MRIERSRGAASTFHHRSISDVHEPTIWIHEVEQPALVVGSTQQIDIVDTDRATQLGVEVSTRRSGGGVVLVEPGTSCWVDVLIPPSDPRWDPDVGRAFVWVGQCWKHALQAVGITELAVHDGPMRDREFGRVLCFAGLGPGEVTMATPGGPSKIVGLSQRRTRSIARFQGLFIGRWDPDVLAGLLRPDVLPAGLDLHGLRIGLPSSMSLPDPELLIEAFTARASAAPIDQSHP